jgi:ribonuclease P protein component
VTVTWVPQRPRATGAPAVAADPTDRANCARGAREPADVGSIAVAFAVGRRVGPAVVRNRLRRRLRAELTGLSRAGTLQPGCYLVSLRPEAATLPGPALLVHLREALAALAIPQPA